MHYSKNRILFNYVNQEFAKTYVQKSDPTFIMHTDCVFVPSSNFRGTAWLQFSLWVGWRSQLLADKTSVLCIAVKTSWIPTSYVVHWSKLAELRDKIEKPCRTCLNWKTEILFHIAFHWKIEYKVFHRKCFVGKSDFRFKVVYHMSCFLTITN